MVDLDLMDIEALRPVQSPSQKQYRELPATRVIKLKSQGCLAEGLSPKVKADKTLVELGLQNNCSKTDNILDK